MLSAYRRERSSPMKTQLILPFITILFTGIPSATGLGQESGDSLQPPFRKVPYLIYSGNIGEMSVVWQMQDTEQCLIEWGTDTTYSMGSFLTSEYGTEHMHSHAITGLSPATKYYYQVSCSEVYCPGNFYSAPLATESDFSFLVYGDTRTNYMWHDSVAAVMVATYVAQSQYQTIVLATGDLVEFGAEESSWQSEFFNEAQTNLRQRMREVPLASCLGNHELYESEYAGYDLDTPLFGQYFPFPYAERRYWSFDYGPAHFTIVDQYPEYYDPYGPGLISSEELAWIESDLSSSTSPWKFAVFHEPGWSCGLHENNEDVQNLLQPLFETYGVQMVFAGHNHYYARACNNGVFHITTGGGGAPLTYPQQDYPNVITAVRVRHFCRVSISEDNLTMEAIDWEGNVVDGFTTSSTGPVNHLLGFVTIGSGPGEVADVLVEADGASDNPDSVGYYGIPLTPGFYDVTASLSGYTTQVFEGIEIVAGTETTLDIVMHPTSVGEEEWGSETALYPPCPDPFRDVTTISFGLPQTCEVRLDVHDVSGRLIRRLADGIMPAGEHSATLEGSGLPAGVFLVRLTAGEQIRTERCVHIR